MSTVTPTSSDFAATAPTANLRTAFGGVWRLTAPKFLTARSLGATLGAVVALGAACYASALHQPQHVLTWVMNSYFSLLLPLIAFVSAAGALRDEMRASTVDYVLVRGIPRPAFVAFKFVAHVVGTELQFLLALAALLAIAGYFRVPQLAASVPTLLLVQVFLVLVFSGFGFACAAVTSRYVVVGLIYGAVVEIGVGQIPTQLNRLSMIHQARVLLEPLAAHASAPAWSSMLATCGVFAVVAAVSVAIAAAVFALRELTDHAET